jgi:hypothetical protein
MKIAAVKVLLRKKRYTLVKVLDKRSSTMPIHAEYTYQEIDMREALTKSGAKSNIEILEGAVVPTSRDGFDGFYHHPLRMEELLDPNTYLADMLTYIQAKPKGDNKLRIAYPLNLSNEFHWVTFYLEFTEMNKTAAELLKKILDDNDKASIHRDFEDLAKDEATQEVIKKLFGEVRAVFYNSTQGNYLKESNQEQLEAILTTTFDKFTPIEVPDSLIKQTDATSCGVIVVEQVQSLLTNGIPHTVSNIDASAQIKTWREKHYTAGDAAFQARQDILNNSKLPTVQSFLNAKTKSPIYHANDDEVAINNMVDKILDALDNNTHFSEDQLEKLRIALLAHGENAYQQLTTLKDKTAHDSQKADYQKISKQASAELSKGNIPAWLQTQMNAAGKDCRTEAKADLATAVGQISPLVK